MENKKIWDQINKKSDNIEGMQKKLNSEEEKETKQRFLIEIRMS